MKLTEPQWFALDDVGHGNGYRCTVQLLGKLEALGLIYWKDDRRRIAGGKWWLTSKGRAALLEWSRERKQ